MATKPRRGHVRSGQSNEEGGRIERRRQDVAVGLLRGELGQEMADRLGVSEATISKDIAAVRESWRERAATDYDAWVAEEAAKLDAFERAVLPQALAGQVSAACGARVMTRRAKLLGLDRAKRLTVTAVAEPEPSRTLGELFGVSDGDERALARLVCAQVKEFGNGRRVGQRG